MKYRSYTGDIFSDMGPYFSYLCKNHHHVGPHDPSFIAFMEELRDDATHEAHTLRWNCLIEGVTKDDETSRAIMDSVMRGVLSGVLVKGEAFYDLPEMWYKICTLWSVTKTVTDVSLREVLDI